MVEEETEEEIEEENIETIERIEDSYLCYNCKSEIYLCSHAYWLCHTCDSHADPARFESYPDGGLAPGGVATLLSGIKNTRFNPLKLEHSDGSNVRWLNRFDWRDGRCKIWGIKADLYSSDPLVDQIFHHSPVFLLPYNHTIRLERRLEGKFFPPIVSLNGRGFVSRRWNYLVRPAEWRNSGFWQGREKNLLNSMEELEYRLFANDNKSNVVAMLVFGSGKYSDISWLSRALHASYSRITDILVFYVDEDDFNDIPKKDISQSDERIIKTSQYISS